MARLIRVREAGASGPGGCCAGTGGTGDPAAAEDLRDEVRRRYGAIARSDSGCCGPDPVTPAGAFGASRYGGSDAAGAGDDALAASLGCGVPTAVADLRPGETVLDLGCGAGADVLISARRVGPAGRVIGLDMTPEMLERARANAEAAGVANVELVHGEIEDIPLPDDSVDVVISNCVINLSTDKPRVFAEAARVLRPGGRLGISDVVADAEPQDGAPDPAAWTGCIAGAMTRDEYVRRLRSAGFTDIAIEITHRVHPSATAAIIRAGLPEAGT